MTDPQGMEKRGFWERLRAALRAFVEQGRRKWTVMVIPHSEQQSRNYRLSNFVLWAVLGSFTLAAIVAAVSLVGYTVQFKELLRLERSKDLHAANLAAYGREVDRLGRGIKPFQTQMASFLSKAPASGPRFQGIGGRDLSLDELGGSLKSYLNQQTRPQEATRGVADHEDFLRDCADLIRQSARFAEKRKGFFAVLPTLWPVKDGIGSVTREPGSENLLRLGLPPGTPIIASGDGQVAAIAPGEQGLLTVRLDHGFGFFTEYRALNHTLLSPKDHVKKGEVIGLSSSRLVYIVQVAGTWVDPLYFSTVR